MRPLKKGAHCEGVTKFSKPFYLARSLGWHVEGHAPMGPDIRDRETMIRGAQHRINRRVPESDPCKMRRFREFVRIWCRKNLRPLDVNSDTSVEHWLGETNYPEWRKQQLREAEDIRRDVFKNKSFIKREFYDEPKHARWINSRSDAFKVKTGPIFHLIEKEIFKHRFFVKYIPVPDRSKYVREYLERPGFKYMATDHTSFEAHITPLMMKTVEMQVYSYMTKNLAERGTFLGLLKQGLLTQQKCLAHNSCSKVTNTTFARMSGDMCTSLGNGLTNLMAMQFIAHELGWNECEGVVEGDDGLFRISGPVPTSEDFASLGFTIKAEISDRIGDAGFCQIYFSEDSDENIVNPTKILLRGGWTMSSALHGGDKILRELSRAKAFSILCESPRNPITRCMANWILRSTEGSGVKFDESEKWWAEQCFSKEIYERIVRSEEGPTIGMRRFVETKWGISIVDQLHVEEYFNSKNGLSPIRDPVIKRICSTSWSEWSWNHNVIVTRKNEPWS